MLTLQHLERQCNGKTLFSELGVTLLPGCLLRLEGGSGSGKTKLMEMIAGLQACARDCVLFAGQESRGDKEFFTDLLYLPEHQQACNQRHTAEKQLHRWAKQGSRDLIPATIHYFQLNHLLRMRLNTLSSGECQRLRLAQLMIQPRAIWLLDRPFLYLDEPGCRQLERLIAGRCQQNGIVIFTHDGETRLNPHGMLDL